MLSQGVGMSDVEGGGRQVIYHLKYACPLTTQTGLLLAHLLAITMGMWPPTYCQQSITISNICRNMHFLCCLRILCHECNAKYEENMENTWSCISNFSCGFYILQCDSSAKYQNGVGNFWLSSAIFHFNCVHYDEIGSQNPKITRQIPGFPWQTSILLLHVTMRQQSKMRK